MSSRLRAFALVPLLLLLSAGAVAAAPEPLPPTALCHTHPWPPMSRARPGPYELGPREVLTIPSDLDGEPIEIGIVRPDVPVGLRLPVIVIATPYLNHTLTTDTVAECQPQLVENFVEHGYAVGIIAIRGTSGSGGCNDLTGPAERADLDQAVTWFGEQPWSNGRVGMIGLSYDGATAWEVASTGNPYLKTIVPMSGVNDFFDLLYRYGMPEYRSVAVMPALYYLYPFYPGDVGTRTPVQSLKSAACPEFAEGVAASAYAAATGQRDPLGYWAERNLRPGVEKNYRGSIFLARGLQDWNVDPAHDFPWITKLDRAGTHVKYMLGQWDHQFPDSASADEVMDPGEPVRWDWADILLDWWDRWLKNDKSAPRGPGAQVQDSTGRWRNEKVWPPHDAQPTDFFLTSARTLSRVPDPEVAEFPIAFDAYKLLSNGLSRTCVCARFTVGVSAQELRFAGIPMLEATVVPLGPGGHLSAFLYAGRDLVGWGAVDLRFAHGGETPQTVIPGTALKVRLPFEPLDVVIPQGQTLTLLVSQSGYGGNDSINHRNSAVVFPLQLRVGGDASRLVLHTFARSSRVFFDPPTTPRPAD